jgi:putative nucleotidyltransferase with HDIG domain
MTTQVVGPLFVAGSRVGRQALVTAHEAIDAVTSGLLNEEDLLWSMVATMQRHLQTHTHAINTAVYAVILARLLALSDGIDVADVGRGALLHDIGKNRVPDHILDKPGPLDEAEWRIMRTHPQIGYEIVTRTLGSVPSYAHIILEHHERVNGSGYPTGRTGDAVPLDSARGHRRRLRRADLGPSLQGAELALRGAADHALRDGRPVRRSLLREFILLIGGRDRFRRSDYQALEVRRAVPAATGGAWAVAPGRST